MFILEAHIVSIIASDTNSDYDDVKLRILDLSPNIARNVVICPMNKFIALINSGIEVPGIDAHNGIVTYYNESIWDRFPVVKDDKSNSSSLVVIKTIYDANGNHEIIISNNKGNMKKLGLQECMDKYRKKLLNIDTGYAKDLGIYPVYKAYDTIMRVETPSGDLFPSLYLPKTDPSIKYTGYDNLFDEWLDIETWKELMDKRGLYYLLEKSYDGMELRLIDTRVPVINIPVGVTDLVGTLNSPNNTIKKIRIPNTLVNIHAKSCTNLKGLDIWEYQEGRDPTIALNASGIRSLNLDKALPSGLQEVTELFNGDFSYNGDFSSLSDLKVMHKVGNEMTITDKLVLPPNVTNMQGCFNDNNTTNGEGLDIKIPSSVKNITYSFNKYTSDKSDIAQIEFSDASNIEQIDYSFNDIGITKLDLSNLPNLSSMVNSFRNLPNLEEVILPPNLKYIYGEMFYNTPKLKSIKLNEGLINISSLAFWGSGIEEVVIPKSVMGCGAEFKKYIIEPRKSLPAGILSGVNRDSIVILPDNLDKLESKSMYRVNVDNVTFPNKSIEISVRTFQDTIGDTLDTFNWGYKTVPGNCFNRSKIGTIILSKDTVKIEYEAFLEAGRVGRLFIPSGVTEFGKNAFSGIGSLVTGGIQFIVVKGSEAEKLAKRKRFRYVSFNTNEEAYEFLTNSNESSEKAKSKARLILGSSSNPIARKLLTEPYINNIDILYNVYREATKSRDMSKINIDLDISKLKPMLDIQDLYNSMQSEFGDALRNDTVFEYKILANEFITCFNLDEIKPKFKEDLPSTYCILSNLITQNTKPIRYFDTVDKWIDVFKPRYNCTDDKPSFKDVFIKSVYRCDYGGIWAIRLFEIIHDSPKYYTLWCITYAGKLVYVTVEYYDIDDINTISTFNALYKNSKYLSELIKSDDSEYIIPDFTKILSNNDLLIRTIDASIIKGCKCPENLALKIKDDFDCFTITVGINRISSSSKGEMLILDIISGDLYTLGINFPDGATIPTFNRSYSTEIISRESYGEWSKKSLRLINKTIFTQYNLVEELEQLYDRDSQLASLMAKDGAYDNLESTFEWELSKLLKDYRVEDIKDTNYKIMELVLGTAFFYPAKKKLGDINKFRKATTITLRDGTILTSYNIESRRPENTFIGVVGKYFTVLGNSSSEAQTVYIHSFNINSILESILNLHNDDAEPYGYLKNKITDPYSFSILNKYYFNYGYHIAICINKADGVPYLAVVDIGGMLPILRFRSLSDLAIVDLALYRDKNDSNKKSSKFYNDLDSIITNVISAYEGYNVPNKSVVSPVEMMRNLIIDGYPNGYKYIGKGSWLFDLAAKQPKNQDNIEE